MKKSSFPEPRPHPQFPVFGFIVVGLAGVFAINFVHLRILEVGGDGLDHFWLAVLMWLGGTYIYGAWTVRREVKRWERRRDDWWEDQQ